MCIVIYQPKGKTVPKKVLKTAFKNNPDGAGFMCQKGKEAPYMEKGFFNFEDFYKAYKPFSKGNYNVAIHFRIATHGAVNDRNCHPFVIADNIEDTIMMKGQVDNLIMHNGIIWSLRTPYNAPYSDTMNFTVNVLHPLKDLKGEVIKELLQNIESTSKFIIMRKNLEPVLAGSFHEENGIYYSNFTYQQSSFTSIRQLAQVNLSEGYYYGN